MRTTWLNELRAQVGGSVAVLRQFLRTHLYLPKDEAVYKHTLGNTDHLVHMGGSEESSNGRSFHFILVEEIIMLIGHLVYEPDEFVCLTHFVRLSQRCLDPAIDFL